MTPRVSVTLLVVLVLTLVGCGAPAPTANKIGVVATTDVYGSVASAVGGDHVKVTSIVHSPETAPHQYEVTPADVTAVADATLLIANGGGYDDFAGKLARAS